MHTERVRQFDSGRDARWASLLRAISAALFVVVSALAVSFFLGACSGDGGPEKEAGTAAVSEDVNSSRTAGGGKDGTMEKSSLLRDGIKKAKLVLETKEGKDILTVAVLDKPKDGESIRYEYEWSKNGKPAGRGESAADFRKGDKISVKITPIDGETRGRSRTLSTEIKNSTPKIVELKSIAGDEKHLSYQVVAEDRDGDPLTYTLVKGAEGMTIDRNNGILQWPMDQAIQSQDITVTVKVSDGQGGDVTYPLKVRHQEMPAK